MTNTKVLKNWTAFCRINNYPIQNPQFDFLDIIGYQFHLRSNRSRSGQIKGIILFDTRLVGRSNCLIMRIMPISQYQFFNREIVLISFEDLIDHE